MDVWAESCVLVVWQSLILSKDCRIGNVYLVKESSAIFMLISGDIQLDRKPNADWIYWID
ncbi:hypothetical protein [Nostoc sp.]|uniref:hypothetical protein n=1 Tax=Nostoc sp. TaxID=1180 RepID=UPI002FF8B6B6